MKQAIYTVLVLMAISFMGNALAEDVKVVAAVTDDDKKAFLLSVGTHYNVKDKVIAYARKKGVPHDELPVLFYIAKKANAKPEVLIDLRRSGKSWMEITRILGLSPEIFHLSVTTTPTHPYGKALAHFKNKAKKDWIKINLADGDIVRLTNLRFLSAVHGITPTEAAKLKAKNKCVFSFHKALKKHRKAVKHKKNQVKKATKIKRHHKVKKAILHKKKPKK